MEQVASQKDEVHVVLLGAEEDFYWVKGGEERREGGREEGKGPNERLGLQNLHVQTLTLKAYGFFNNEKRGEEERTRDTSLLSSIGIYPLTPLHST